MHFTLQDQPYSYVSLSEPVIGKIIPSERPAGDAFDIKLRQFAYAAFVALTLNTLFLLLLTQITHSQTHCCIVDPNDVVESEIYGERENDYSISSDDEPSVEPLDLSVSDVPIDDLPGPILLNELLRSAALLDALLPDRRQNDD
jgi:hypothetical protein